MPSHYPTYYDYADIEVDNKMLPTPTAFPETDLSGILIAVGLIATLITICVIVLVVGSELFCISDLPLGATERSTFANVVICFQ